jgi:pimeloyl-ACP methyl ester carboxylesterase
VLAAALGLVVAQGTTASGRTDGTAPRPSGRLVDIGGNRKLFLECRGEGSPTVVLVSGGGGASDEWTHVLDPARPDGELRASASAVLPRIARFTRVCAYDRPGTARVDDELSPSTPVPQPTTAQADAADLRALLDAGHVRGPYVLVGASWGGMIASLLARNDPRSVAGVVLSDGASEFLKDTVSADQWNAWMHLIETSTPPGREAPDYVSSVEELRVAPAPPLVPAVVLTADKPWNLPLGEAGATWPAWQSAQDRLAAMFHARHVTDTASGHGIAVENPRVVANAVRDVVRTARRASAHHATSTRR